LCGGDKETTGAVELCTRYLPRGISTLLERSNAKRRRRAKKKGGGGAEGKGDDGGGTSSSIPKAVQVAVSILGAWSKMVSAEGKTPMTPGEVKCKYVEEVGGLPLYGADLFYADMMNDATGGGGLGGKSPGKKDKKKTKKQAKKKSKGGGGGGGSGGHKTVVVVVGGQGVEIRDPGRIFAKKPLSVIPYVSRRGRLNCVLIEL
jgi:hypothetical protein